MVTNDQILASYQPLKYALEIVTDAFPDTSPDLKASLAMELFRSILNLEAAKKIEDGLSGLGIEIAHSISARETV